MWWTVGRGVLVASVALSLVLSLAMLVSPSSLPAAWRRSGEGEDLVRAWGATWLALSVVHLAVLLTAFRRRERWASLVMSTVPLIWLSHFLLVPEMVVNLVAAIVTALAVGLSARSSNGESSRA